MALAMLDTVETAGQIIGERLQLRIGLNTGAVVAGVLGTHKFVYDVWGDTVNTAKRMESYGLPGHVHIFRRDPPCIRRRVPLRAPRRA
jgi:adenylate cyclase